MPPSVLPLSKWCVVSLRPVGQHARLLRAAQALGACGVPLPGLRLAAREDTPTRHALDSALTADSVIFTSPAAVRYARRLLPQLPTGDGSQGSPRRFALGAATAAALLRAGGGRAIIPPRTDSEALLALPELGEVRGRRIGLVTAPGGRGLLAAALRERGAALCVAEVYERRPARLGLAHVRRFMAAPDQGAACVTSAEALDNVLAMLPDAARTKLLRGVAVVSSARLAAFARTRGFATTVLASAPAPRDMLAALVEHVSAQRIR
ncbi:MAG: uroporphyrinogen-III synthase [Proteobacteria bacterium]|nr:uroporphyrinogen-III synthase [Pseudomonadota bacterium]